MKRLIISGLATVFLIAAATTMLQSHSPSTGRTVAAAAMASSQAAASVKLPTEEFDDMSLVYSTATKP